MRINEPNRTGMLNAYNKANKAQVSKEVKKSMGKDEVKISDEALELLKMGEEADLSPARKAKINDLKKQVEQGTYSVPSEKIAEKFLSFWKKP